MLKIYALILASLISVEPVGVLPHTLSQRGDWPIPVVQQESVVADDEKLPINIQAFSTRGNPANFPGGYTVTVSNADIGVWVPRVVTDPPAIEGYFVPSGPVGTTNLVVSGTNSKGVVINNTLIISVVGGAATSIQITPLPPVLNTDL